MTRIEKIPSAPVVSRRSFVIGTAASGIVLGYVSLSGSASFAQGAAKFEPSVWYSIGIDGMVTVVSGKAEMGQHVASTMGQLIAEELEPDWKDLKIVFPTNDPKYNDPLLGDDGCSRERVQGPELAGDASFRQEADLRPDRGGR